MFLENGEGIRKELLDLFLRLVESLTKGWFFLLGQLAYAFGRLGQAAVGAQYGCFRLFPVRAGID